MVGVSWVYFRRRDQLIAIATEFGLDNEGTRLVELEEQYRDASGSEHSDSKSRSRSVSPVPRDRVVPQVIVTAPGSQPPSSRLLRGNRAPLVDGEPSLRPLPFGGTTAGPGDLIAPVSAENHEDNPFGGTAAGPSDLSAPASAENHEDNPFGGTTAGPGDLSASTKNHEARTTAGPNDLETLPWPREPTASTPRPKGGTPRNVYKDPSEGNPMQGNPSPKAGTPRKAHQDPTVGTPLNVYKDNSGGNHTRVQEDLKEVTSRSKDGAPTTPGQEDEEDHETQTTEEIRSTRSSSWGSLEDGEPSQRSYPFGETTTEVCAIAIPTGPDTLSREVLRRLRQANLLLNRAKCKFFKRSLVYLGHVISCEGILTDPDKIAAVLQLQPPTTCRELRRCLWIASWYRRFVPNFADIVQPMSLLLKKGQKWDWKPKQQAAFEELKARLTEAPVLACPDFSEKHELQRKRNDVHVLPHCFVANTTLY
ncbi:hypothetical protein ACLKA7_004930 [Drosophila subpalustris]